MLYLQHTRCTEVMDGVQGESRHGADRGTSCRPPHSATALSKSQQENKWLTQNAYASLNIFSWVRLFIVGTALMQPNEWIKSNAENQAAKPGWCPCFGFPASWLFLSVPSSHTGNPLIQFQTLRHIPNQLKLLSVKGAEHQITLLNISNDAFVTRRPTTLLFSDRRGTSQLQGGYFIYEPVLKRQSN